MSQRTDMLNEQARIHYYRYAVNKALLNDITYHTDADLLHGKAKVMNGDETGMMYCVRCGCVQLRRIGSGLYECEACGVVQSKIKER